MNAAMINDSLWAAWGRLALGFAATALLLWGLASAGWLAIDRRVAIGSMLIYATCFSLAAVAHRHPRGNEFISQRLLGAAFCRTILPLLAIAVMSWYFNLALSKGDGIVIAIGYLVPLLTSAAVALRNSPATPVHRETSTLGVDRTANRDPKR